MTLEEIFQRTLVDSGQFQLGPDKVEINIPAFKQLVDRCLEIYSGYSPRVVYLYIYCNSAYQYTFDEINTPQGIPDNIISITPIRVSGVVPYYLREFDRPRSTLDIKVEFPWVYRKPTLTVPTSAEYDVQATYLHKMVNVANNGLDPEWELNTLTGNADEFFNLLTGRFMQAIGRNRRAFTIGTLPIQSDASELVSDGKEREKEAMEDLINNKAKWYLAWGG